MDQSNATEFINILNATTENYEKDIDNASEEIISNILRLFGCRERSSVIPQCIINDLKDTFKYPILPLLRSISQPISKTRSLCNMFWAGNLRASENYISGIFLEIIQYLTMVRFPGPKSIIFKSISLRERGIKLSKESRKSSKLHIGSCFECYFNPLHIIRSRGIIYGEAISEDDLMLFSAEIFLFLQMHKVQMTISMKLIQSAVE